MLDSSTPAQPCAYHVHPKFYWFYILGIVAILVTTVFQPGPVKLNTALALSPGSVSISLISSPTLVSDSNNCPTAGPTAAYVGFKVTNTTGSTLTNLSATLSGFTSGFALAGGQAGTLYIGTLAPGASTTVYYYVSYPCATNKNSPTDTLTLTVSDGTAQTNTFNQTFSTLQTISANAGGQIASTLLGVGAVVGQVITYDVGYSFGNISSSDHFLLQPAGLPSFNAGCFQLVSTNVITSVIAAIPVGTTNQLYFTSSTSQTGQNNGATVEYAFKILCTGVTTTATPYASQLSGTQDKYTGNFNQAGSTIAVPPASNSFTIAKSASPTLLPTGGVVTYTVNIANSFSQPAYIDVITDTLPAGVTYGGLLSSSNVTTANSSSYPSGGATSTLVFKGIPGSSYQVPGNGSVNLVFTATVQNVAGTYTNTVTAAVGSTPVGTSSAKVGVGSADLALDKTVDNPVPDVNTFITYTLTLTNTGTTLANGVVISDVLPSGENYVTSTATQGNYSNTSGLWTVGTIYNAQVVSLTISVGVSNTGGITNTATVAASDQYDPNLSNNTSSQPIIVVVPNGVTALTTSSQNLDFQVNSGATTPSQKTLILSSEGLETSWVSSVTYPAGTPNNWLNLSQTNGIVLPGSKVPIVVSTNPQGLASGTYIATILFTTAANNTTNTIYQASVTVKLVVGSPYTYYLPNLSNGTGGFTSYVVLHNIGNGAANPQIQYYDHNGSNLNLQSSSCSNLAANGECSPFNPFTQAVGGTAVLTSDQPLAVLVAESTPFGGSAYPVAAGASSSLIVPLAINGALGFGTQLSVFNGGTNSTNVTVNFFDQSGVQLPAATKTNLLAAHSSLNLDQTGLDSNLPAGFYGWATVSGDVGSQLVAQVLEQNSRVHFVALANAEAKAQATLYAPAIFNHAFGGFVTGANLVNPGASPVTVNITYYSQDGTAYTAPAFSIAAHAIQPIYQGGHSGGTGVPANGLPDGFVGAAAISTSNGGLVMAVNEQGGTTQSGTAQSGTYLAVASGANQVGLPVVANGGNSYVSGATVFNTSGQTVSGYIHYYTAGGAEVTAQPFSVAPHSSYLSYQGAASLPAGFLGQAEVVQTSGPDSSLLVTTNVQSSSLFYSYTEPA